MEEVTQLVQNYLSFTMMFGIYLFVGFIVVIKLGEKAKGTRWYKPYLVIFGIPFTVADWLFDIVVIPVFWDKREHNKELLTDRMKRYKRISKPERMVFKMSKFRYVSSVNLCRILNVIDKGHC